MQRVRFGFGSKHYPIGQVGEQSNDDGYPL